MFAIIQTGGKQYKVKAGDELLIERLPDEEGLAPGKALKLDQVLLCSRENAVEIGRPYLEGAYCEAELLKEIRSPKTVSFKYIRREKAATKIGHRQNYLKIKIKSIQGSQKTEDRGQRTEKA